MALISIWREVFEEQGRVNDFLLPEARKVESKFLFYHLLYLNQLSF